MILKKEVHELGFTSNRFSALKATLLFITLHEPKAGQSNSSISSYMYIKSYVSRKKNILNYSLDSQTHKKKNHNILLSIF